MSLEDDLYTELFDLRADLRQKNPYSNGRLPLICSDEALREMAQRVPTKAEDFAAIEGVGQKFVEQYGEDFLQVTSKYAVTAAKGTGIDPDLARTLRELQKKLINISRGNRLLFQPKTSRKYSYDLLSLGLKNGDVIGLLFGRKRVLTLCDPAKNPDDTKAYKRLSDIIREVNRDQREKGTYDLYIAYPFVEGRLLGGEAFSVRAPLALFPVVLSKEGSAIRLEMDGSRDAIYNNTLVLAAIKMGGRRAPLPDNVLDDYDETTFLPELLKYYADQDLPIESPRGLQTEPFVEYKADEFPKYNPGEMHLHLNAVIGKYPSYSSYIQRDFDLLLAGREINSTLADLVKDLNKEDFYSDYPLPLSEAQLKDKGLEASEKDLTYINALNSAQENVLTAARKEDELVVQGPPGTGKSQVITGLISSAVIAGKTVLMVSEKKTALDVVYSRLGDLAKYCMQIDDTADKDRFYKQLGIMLNQGIPAAPADLGPLAADIDKDVNNLGAIATSIYEPGDFGIAPCRLYAMNRWLDTGDKVQYSVYETYKSGVASSLLNVKYGEVAELHRKFGDPSLVSNFREYTAISEKSPWMTVMKQDLSGFTVDEMRADLDRLNGEVAELNKKGFLARLFSKGKVTRDATSVVNKYFENYNSKTIDTVMRDPKGIAAAMDDYDRFTARATAYRGLSPLERTYGEDLLNLGKELKTSDGAANDGIYRYILNNHLQRFDASHKHLMQELHDFDSIVADMDRKIGQKRNLTQSLLDSTLRDNLRYITESKRRGDIARIVENKRKWSLTKFIDRYSYELFKGIRVWLLTPEVVSEIIPMEMGLFDLLVFDEASQMYVERGIPSIYRAKKVVVAGDHKQLRPSSLGTGRITFDEDEDDDEEAEVGAALEEESLLDLARSRYDSILLNFHYRSKYEELIAFSNYAFYGGRLYVSPNVVQPERPPIEVIRVDGRWENRTNCAEAKRIVQLLQNFFLTRKENETVGIISFNVSQRDLISDLIDDAAAQDPAFAAAVNRESKRKDNGEDVGLFVKNIESVQGDERDVIIFSIGYAKNTEGKLVQRFGWLNARGGENRLNVAISRAKKKIYIVTSFEPEELNVDGLKSEGPRILKKYLQYARAISDGNTAVAQSILNSFGAAPPRDAAEAASSSAVMDRVYNALVRKGYTIERNVGIGGYTIDLAVKQNDRFILGIESDSRVYGLTASTRERDYHRQKYLESRGWHIHRVWTPGMWKDPEAEITKIVRAIEKAQTPAAGTKPGRATTS
ncbi:MAG: AAA domain-containing protein [Candidatus Methanomethylophilus sp.]|nr:AAA domain-containing protein [Methanomethylophilus sp.]